VRLIFPILMGVLGCAILVGLGVWQVQRLHWKEGVLADITVRIGADPVAVPAVPDAVVDGYLPVTVTGAMGGEELRVLTSLPDLGGPGFRVISVLTTGDRRLLVDLGFVPADAADVSRMAPAVTVTGNVHWPDEVDGFTPDPEGPLWFARDAAAMATALQAEPFLIVARTITPDDLGTVPLPIGIEGIPNDHLNYAITWFLLALVWALMSGYWLWRTARRT
jgi:surfeit locus 1 family protein